MKAPQMHRFMWLAAAVLCLGCATSGKLKVAKGTEGTSRARYYEGMKELAAHNYMRAGALLGLVARGPRYVRYSALAQLRLADLEYHQARYPQAVLRYNAFVAQHPNSPNLPYAKFMIASSFIQRMPSRFFLLPPAAEGDLTTTRQAVKALNGFLLKFPISRFAEQARKMLTRAERLLCEHELYVASFYKKRNKPRAVAWRLNGAIKEFPKCARTEKNVWLMAVSYAKAGSRSDAARAYGMYLQHFPKGKRSKNALAALEKIRKTPSKKTAP